ncbi:unnamed protein product [Brugia timori]|uniref:Uncharacterized protein n=1 Tax=Brugia timori TaxID=42155 RepID=A0A0R3QK05_9BILA|nr:unnamed protein product [Brugia timori]
MIKRRYQYVFHVSTGFTYVTRYLINQTIVFILLFYLTFTIIRKEKTISHHIFIKSVEVRN